MLKRLLFAIMDYMGLWFSNAVIAVSKTEKTFLAKRTAGSGRIHVVWDPVDFENMYEPAHTSAPLLVRYI